LFSAGDCLHRRVRQPLLERAHRGRVAAKETTGKGVDLIKRDAHDESLELGWAVAK
jgi:hypothetical protein